MIPYDPHSSGNQKYFANLKVVRESSPKRIAVYITPIAIKFGTEGNERHRDIERTCEISVLYSLLIGHSGRWLGVAPGASGTVGALSLNSHLNRSTLALRRQSQPRPEASGHCETMKILCAVNQAECFRRGILAPRSTIKLDLNASKLPRDLRTFVADNLYEGYKLGFDDHINTETGESKAYASEEFELYRPDLTGFMEAILRAKEFQETVDADSEHHLPFPEWVKKADEAAHSKREKLARELADTQAQPRTTSQDQT